MLLRDDLVEELDRVVRVPPEAVDRAELDRLLPFGGREDQLGHSSPMLARSALADRAHARRPRSPCSKRSATGRQTQTFVADGAQVGRSSLRPSRCPFDDPECAPRRSPLPRERRGSRDPDPRAATPRTSRGPALPPWRAPSTARPAGAPRPGVPDPPRSEARRGVGRPSARLAGSGPRTSSSVPTRRCSRRLPRESAGLFELVPAIARRALELGLTAREPSFHVFVAAEPEVMIEDDIVRYAIGSRATRPSAARHRLRPRLRPSRGAAPAHAAAGGRARPR